MGKCIEECSFPLPTNTPTYVSLRKFVERAGGRGGGGRAHVLAVRILAKSPRWGTEGHCIENGRSFWYDNNLTLTIGRKTLREHSSTVVCVFLSRVEKPPALGALASAWYWCVHADTSFAFLGPLTPSNRDK